MLQNKLIHVGTFGRPVGLKGEINLISHTANLKLYIERCVLVNEDGSIGWHLRTVKLSKHRVIVKIKNKNTRESIESLIGKKIFVDRINFTRLKNNEYYIVDLVGCNIMFINKKIIGKVISVENFGAGNLINVKSIKDKNFYIPVNENNIISIDVENKKIIIDDIKGMIN